MIGFPYARHKNLLLPPRTESTPLDQERNFLLHIVGQSMKKGVSRATLASSQPPKRT